MKPRDLAVILFGVEHPGNLGAVARAMKNFGVTDLVLINPLCEPGAAEAKNRAKWANDVLATARIGGFELLDEYDLIVGTTAELGNDYNLPRTPLFPRQLAEKLSEMDGSVALVFGRESDGLTNDELKRCDLTVTIPTSPDYPTLNLSHAVAVILTHLTTEHHAPSIAEHYPLVKAAAKRQLLKLIDETLDAMTFQTPEKRETQRVLWRRLLGKAVLTQREAMALLGFFKKTKKAL